MTYKDLHEIIRHLKRVVPCNVCKSTFTNEDLHVLSTYQNEGWLSFCCHSCKNQLLVHVAIVNRLKKNNLNISIHTQKPVTSNEVIEMHNFLKNFNGDFKNLFTI